MFNQAKYSLGDVNLGAPESIILIGKHWKLQKSSDKKLFLGNYVLTVKSQVMLRFRCFKTE